MDANGNTLSADGNARDYVNADANGFRKQEVLVIEADGETASARNSDRVQKLLAAEIPYGCPDSSNSEIPWL